MTSPLDSSKLPSQEHLIASEASRLQEDAPPAEWPNARNRGLLQAAKQALAALDQHAIAGDADRLYQARAYLRPAIRNEEAFNAAMAVGDGPRVQEDALLKCPFCNGEAEIINCSVHCNNPWCEAQPFTAGQSEAEAIAAWNRRAVGGGLQVQPAPRNFDAERAAWLADKIVAHGDYAKEAAEMLLRWPLAVRSETKDVQEDAPRDTAGVPVAVPADCPNIQGNAREGYHCDKCDGTDGPEPCVMLRGNAGVQKDGGTSK